MKLFKCFECTDKYEQLPDLLQHIEDEHGDIIPKDQSVGQYYYMMKTGKTHGSCVVCKNKTKWNEETGKYHRFCDNPKCKERYREIFVKRMIGVHGVATQLNDPEHQKKMLANRSISGKYKWRDGKEFTYTGSYEKDFLQFLDVFMNFDSTDIMSPSPHTYYYMYEGKKKFYIPDFFIPSLNLEIEVKDGGKNPNNHHKIQTVDKVKEKLKDEVLTSQKNFSYIKIVDKEYDNFFDLLMQMKVDIQKDGSSRQMFDLADRKGLVVRGPVKESLYVGYDELNHENLKEIIQGIDSINVIESVIESTSMDEIYKEELRRYKEFMATDPESVLQDIRDYQSDFDTLDTHHKIDSYLKEKGIQMTQIRRPGFVTPYMDNLFINILESLDVGNKEECLTTINRDFKVALKSCADEGSIARYNRDAKAMKYYFLMLAGKLDKQRLVIFDIANRIEDIVTEALVVEGQEAYPVYVLLTHTGTLLSNTIKNVTDKAYSHASISFDPQLNNMYSFGRKYKSNPLIGRFVKEDIQAGLFKDVSDTASYSLYVTFVTKEQLDGMITRLESFKENGKGFSYSFKGLLNFKMGRETDSVDAFFCSQFVDHILSAGRQYFDRHSSLVAPTDFSLHKDFYFVTKGKLNNYNPIEAARRTADISTNARFQNKVQKDKVVYLGLTNKQAKSRVFTGDDVTFANDLPSLKKIIGGGVYDDYITHYSLLLLDDLKRQYNIFQGEDAYRIHQPVKIKLTNVNLLT